MFKGSKYGRGFAVAAVASLLSAAVLSMTAQSSRAQTLYFTFTGVDAASFAADSSPSTMANFGGFFESFVLAPQLFSLDGVSYPDGNISFNFEHEITLSTGPMNTYRTFNFLSQFISPESSPSDPVFVTGSYTNGLGESLLISSSAPVSSVPEPSTWAMMLLGFGGLGYCMHRKARRNNTASMSLA